MKKKVQNPLKLGLLIAVFLMVGNVAFGATYTAVASGNWSSAATWGGSAPAFNITAADQINIGIGITVTMDQNVILNNALAYISVAGTLSGAPYIKLDVVSGTISGSGSLNAANIDLNAAALFGFSGVITADTLTNSIVSLSNSSQITVNDALELPANLNIMLGGSLTMGNNSNIAISGGEIVVSGGTLNLSANYNVAYLPGAINMGAEVTGAGLKNITINVGASNNVALTAALITNDSLKFTSGALSLNGSDLTVNGVLSGNVMIQGASLSNLNINTPGGVATLVQFAAGFQTLGGLAINVGSGNPVQIGSNLDVLGNLTISSGSKLNITGQNLMTGGIFNNNSNGSFVVNSGSQLNFDAGSSIAGTVSIIGTDLGKFMLDIGSADQAVLTTNLTVDTLSLQGGLLVLNKNNLTVNAGIAAGGSGLIASGDSSNIVVSSSAAVLGSLSFATNADTVNSLTVNVSGGGSLKIGSDLVVNNMLTFTAGYVDVQSNNLMIGVAGSINGANANAYVITGSGGYLTMNASVSNTTTFQVGTGSNYLPAAITLNNGSGKGTIGLNVSAGVYSAGNAGVEISNYEPMVDATWLFQNNIGSGLDANMQLFWQASAEVNGFVHTDDYISHYASAWDDIGDSMTATLSGSLYSVTRANVVSMSPFTVFDQTTVPTGVAAVTSTAGEFQVYPNPTNDNLYVKNPSMNGNTIYVEVYNTLGQLVTKTQFNNDLFIMPVSSLPEGNYLLRLYNDNMSVTRKFVKIQ